MEAKIIVNKSKPEVKPVQVVDQELNGLSFFLKKNQKLKNIYILKQSTYIYFDQSTKFWGNLRF
jgi:hypothetical protein